MLMERQFPHAHLPMGTADERARQDFVQSFKLHLAQDIVPDIQRVYEKSAEPEFVRRHGRLPRDGAEVQSVMENDHVYRTWESLYRTAQEMIWTSVIEPIARERDAMIEKARISKPLGSLKLNPDLAVPRYISAVDIHCMPGGYHSEDIEGDVAQGALYDRGVHIYGMGGLGPKTDMMGRLVSAYLRDSFPDLKPKRILDLGCTVGHSLLPYAEMFPGAELYGIDVGAPVLRYAHARAESMGIAAHFEQMNAEELDYPDDYFDLVVSHILLHETSNKAVRRVLKESRRVVRPGGIVAHIDMDGPDSMTPFNSFMMMFDGFKNNEPFWSTFRKMDPKALLTEAGFDGDGLFVQRVSRAYSGQAVFQEGKADGGRGYWRLIGGRK
jgi:SAM-dependent methyltransferase